MENISEALKEHLDRLSEESRRRLQESGWEEKLATIAIKHNLAAEQTRDLEIETALVLLGLEDQADYAENLGRALGELAGPLAQEVEQTIFAGLAEYLIGLETQHDRTEKELEEKFKQLPESVQEAIVSVETENIIQEIGKKNRLHIDQMGILDEEVSSVMLGLTPYYQFVDSIQKKLGIDRAAAENITLDINTEIFLPIRESLKRVSAGKGGLPGRKEVLKDIEDPKTIFEQKMAKMFNLPKEQNTPQSEQPAEKKADPYLEPPN